jgi:hypothetical protein
MGMHLFDENELDETIGLDHVDRTPLLAEPNRPVTRELALEWMIVEPWNLSHFFNSLGFDLVHPRQQLRDDVFR